MVVPERPEKGWGPQGTGIVVALIDGVNQLLYRVGAIFGFRRQSVTVAMVDLEVLTAAAPVVKISCVAPITLGDITAGVADGQTLTIQGMSDTNTVTILSAGNVSLNGDVILLDKENVSMRWDLAELLWVEENRSN